MPDYDFKCGGCGHTTEQFFKMLEVPMIVKCPTCYRKSNPLAGFAKRVFTAPRLSLNHWVPDYRNCDDGQKEATAAGIYE